MDDSFFYPLALNDALHFSFFQTAGISGIRSISLIAQFFGRDLYDDRQGFEHERQSAGLFYALVLKRATLVAVGRIELLLVVSVQARPSPLCLE